MSPGYWFRLRVMFRSVGPAVGLEWGEGFTDWLLSAGGITGKTVDDTAGVSLGAGRITTHSSAVTKQRIASNERQSESFFITNFRNPTRLNHTPRETIKA